MVEDAAYDAGLGDAGDRAHHAAAPGTDEGVDLGVAIPRRTATLNAELQSRLYDLAVTRLR